MKQKLFLYGKKKNHYGYYWFKKYGTGLYKESRYKASKNDKGNSGELSYHLE